MHRTKLMILTLFMVMFSSIALSPARAANATVTDCVNFTGVGSISQAVADANIAPGGTISVTCTGTIIFDNEFTISAAVIINNDSGGAVTFDETGDNNRFFFVSGSGNFTLNGFTLQNGDAAFGGAIDNSGTLTISNSTFAGNGATNNGGAIYNNGATLTITNSTFTSNNSATVGGAIAIDAGTPTIINSEFTNNSATVAGGAIASNGTLTITNSNLATNFVTNAGGLGGAIANAGNMTITNSTLSNNLASNGGAIYNNGTASSQDSHYENNTCTATVITNNGGNTRNTAVTSAVCPGTDPIALSVSPLACVGNNAVFTINAGDANFDITGTGTAQLPITNSPSATITLTGPATWSNIIVTERRGERQSLPLGGITCPSGVITPPSLPPAPTVTVTVLGCALDSTDGVEVAGAPDNTYCRILMKNGGVVSYSGAIPADLIGLGVILAVDVYRLEGGRTVNTFPDYARVCLSGTGRLFYMDSRNAPRFSVELASESIDGLTCGWIPAPGTLILTN